MLQNPNRKPIASHKMKRYYFQDTFSSLVWRWREKKKDTNNVFSLQKHKRAQAKHCQTSSNCYNFFPSFSIRVHCKQKVIWVWKPWILMCITYNVSNTLKMHQWMHHQYQRLRRWRQRWRWRWRWQQYQPMCAAFQLHTHTHTRHSNANAILSINITKGTKLIIVHGTSSKCIWSVLFAVHYIHCALCMRMRS